MYVCMYVGMYSVLKTSLFLVTMYNETETKKIDPRRDLSRGLESRLQALM